MNTVAVIVTCRRGDDAHLTLRSLAQQTFKAFDIHVVQDETLRGHAWALNRGLEDLQHGDYQYVLFSDDDIIWRPDALERLVKTLEEHPAASYAYGAYEMGGKVQCDKPFDGDLLRQVNYISTMSLVRAERCGKFDETLVRLIGWDYWLTLLEQCRVGIYCGGLIFSTPVRMGITESDKANNRLRKEVVARKHGIPLDQVL